MTDETDGGASAPVRWVRARSSAHWSPALAAAIVARVGAGELLYRVLREDGMPTPQSVGRWAKERPEFGAALAQARAAGGRAVHGGGVSTYSPGVAEEVFERLSEGESMTRIGGDPTMPSLSTLMAWLRGNAAFNAGYLRAKEVQAIRICDRAGELVEEATPETAYTTHVKLAHLRWWAGVLAPRKYRIRLSEPDTPRETVTVVFRKFISEEDPETGKMKVVALCPNPHTGEVEREDAPGWTPPANTIGLPGGWDTHPGGWFGEDGG